MLQNLTKEIQLRTRADLMLPWVGAVGLAVAVGIAYFFAARLSLALLAKPDGVAGGIDIKFEVDGDIELA
jgi:hypothetical protein